MEKFVGPFPVAEGQDGRGPAAVMSGRPEEYRESRSRLGVHLERAYEQVTPMGTFVVVYVESEGPFGEVLPRAAASELPIDREFVAAVQTSHGFDPYEVPEGDPPELLADWVDDEVTERKAGLAFCAPVRPDGAEVARQFAKEAWGARGEELAASRRALGVTREAVMLHHTPMGDVIAVYLEGDDPAAGNRAFAASETEFDTWFKDECRRVFPDEIDFDQPVPPITALFDSLELDAAD